MIEAANWPPAAILVEDRFQLARCRTVQDYAVDAEIELMQDGVDALRRRARRRRRQPFGRQERGDVLELLGRCLVVDRAAKRTDHRIRPEALEDRGVPAVRLDE